MSNILVIVAARGGSKGIKGKNVRPLMGKPLIAYSIEQALAWGKARRIVVSTDSDEIAQAAKVAGAEVPFIRPENLSTDEASKGEVIRHALVECERIYDETYDIVVDLDVTSPVRTVSDLDNCLELFNEKSPDTLYSATEAHKNPYFNMVEEVSAGRFELCKKNDAQAKRRQDAPKVYSLNASIYFYDRNYLLNSEDLFAITKNSVCYLMNEQASVDIDREIDFKFIEYLVKEGTITL